MGVRRSPFMRQRIIVMRHTVFVNMNEDAVADGDLSVPRSLSQSVLRCVGFLEEQRGQQRHAKRRRPLPPNMPALNHMPSCAYARPNA